MTAKQYRITITLSKELYLELEERAKKEVRSIGNLGLYLLLLGIEADKKQNAQSEGETA